MSISWSKAAPGLSNLKPLSSRRLLFGSEAGRELVTAADDDDVGSRALADREGPGDEGRGRLLLPLLLLPTAGGGEGRSIPSETRCRLGVT